MTAESTVVYSDRIMQMIPIQTASCDDWRAVIVLCGEFDVANAGELRLELNRHLDEGRRVIRVDAGGVEFIDSTALGELVNASERCRAEHGSLILTGVTRRMRRLLSVAGLEHVLLVDTANDDDEPARVDSPAALVRGGAG
jgi:anti-sigma B factor antagonist